MDGNAIVLTTGLTGDSPAKTAHGLIRGTERYRIVGVIDPLNPGKDAGEVLDGIPRHIPLFDSMDSLLVSVKESIQYCLIGVAPKGGKLPLDMKADVIKAIRAGISIVSGLHEYLSDMPELATLATQHGVKLIDLRKPKPKSELHFWSGSINKVTCPRIAVLGTDCNLGKRTTTRLLTEAARQAGFRAEMIYTGQTGWMQGGKYGFIVDSTYNDFVSGEIEHAIVSCFEEMQPDVLFVEGQSALRNPSGPCGTEFLMSGGVKYVVLQHAPARTYYNSFESVGARIPSLKSEVELIRLYGAEVLAVTLNTSHLSPTQVGEYKKQYEDELGIPVLLPLEEGVGRLLPMLTDLIKSSGSSFESQ